MTAAGPYWVSGEGDVTLYLGDCLDVLRGLPADSVDAIVTDPPYGLAEIKTEMVVKALTAWLGGDRLHVPDGRGFMGREWDKFVPPPGIWDEALRVLKPGGHLLSFAGTRMSDLMMLSIRLAGFKVFDSVADLTGQDAPGLMWIHGQGFPKSRDIGKDIDRMAGAEREAIGPNRWQGRKPTADHSRQGLTFADDAYVRPVDPPLTAPATEEAARWEGWGTALKPAWEPIVVARKPLSEGSVAGNVLRWGTGGLNIAATKVSHGADVDLTDTQRQQTSTPGWRFRSDHVQPKYAPDGRWPTNLVLSHSAGCVPAGTRQVRGDRSGQERGKRPGGFGDVGAERGDKRPNGPQYGDADGLEVVEVWVCDVSCPVGELDRQSGATVSRSSVGRQTPKQGTPALGNFAGTDRFAGHDDTGGASRFYPVFKYQAKAPASERPRLEDGTAHETVKPLGLICWLVRLITPPGGTVLDMFAGSGPVGEAAVIEGFRCVLIEKERKSAELIRKRLGKPIQPVMFGLEG